MHSRSRPNVIALLAALAAVWCAVPAAAQPSIPRGLAGKNAPLTEQEQRLVADTVAHWAPQFASEEAEIARLAKRRLLEPMNEPVVQPIFRNEYGRILVSEMEPLLNGPSAFAAMNAVQVLGVVASDACLTVLRERLDPQREQRWAVRLWAVQGVQNSVSVGAALERNISNAMRDIVRASEHETNWLVLLRLFEALEAANTSQGRMFQIDVLRNVLDKIEASTTSSTLMQPVHRSINRMMAQFLDMAPDEQRNFGTAVAPQLGRVFDISMKHWESVPQASQPIREAYRGAVHWSETLLRQIDPQVRRGQEPPKDSIVGAWGNGNRSGYERAIQYWQGVLREPPYAGNRR